MKIIICADCGKKGEHQARNLCVKCYIKFRRESFSPEQRDHYNKVHRDWYARTIDDRRAYFRKYYRKHKKQMIASMMKWQRKNREKQNEYRKEFRRKQNEKEINR